MPKPTRQEIIEAQLARQWAEQVQQTDAEYERKGRRYSGDPMRAAAAYILSHTPAPTMAEVEWDDEKHRFGEAEHPLWRTVIMLEPAEGKMIEVFIPHLREFRYRIARRETLTPTGKRYTLTEVETHAS